MALRRLGDAAGQPLRVVNPAAASGSQQRGPPAGTAEGKRRPHVLLIHGSTGSVEDWQPVMDALAGSFQLTAFDRPGHGFSGDTGKYSLEENADMALKLIDALKLENVVVVGHTAGPASRN